MPNRHFLFCARRWVINTMMGRTLPELHRVNARGTANIKAKFCRDSLKLTEKMMPNRHFLFCARPWVINTMMGRTLPELHRVNARGTACIQAKFRRDSLKNNRK